MCLIALAWDVDPAYPLLVAANRDEFHARPSAAAAFWDDAPQILAGRDLQARGTWLGISRSGRFAAITNIRDPDGGIPAPRSRGELTADFLRGDGDPESYLAEVAARIAAYQGFNLLLGDRRELWYLHGVAGGRPIRLQPGIYGLSNAALDVSWPKVQRARDCLGRLARGTREPAHADLAACVADRSLAEPQDLEGHGLEGPMARRLSAQFIVTEAYGTRCQSTLYRSAAGTQHFCETRFDADGARVGRAEFVLPPEG